MLDPAKFEHWAESIVAISQHAAVSQQSTTYQHNSNRQVGYATNRHCQHIKSAARVLADDLLASYVFVRAGNLDSTASAALEQAMRRHFADLAAFSIATNKELAESNSPYRVRMYARTGQHGPHGTAVNTCSTEIHDTRTSRRVAILSTTVD